MIAYIPWLDGWTYTLRDLRESWVVQSMSRSSDHRSMQATLEKERGYRGPYDCKPIHLERV